MLARSTSVNLPCVRGTFRQVSPTFRVTVFPCILSVYDNLPFVRGTFRQLWSTSRVSAVPAVNFCQHFVHPWDLLKRSVQLLDLLSTSVNYPCGLGTFCQLSVLPRDLQPTFCASMGSSINFPCSLGTFRQHFVLPRDLPSTSVKFPCLRWAFGQLSVRLRDFPSTSLSPRDLPSTFCVSTGPFISFSLGSGTSRQVRQLSVHLWDLLSTSVNFLCVHSTFHQLLSTFCATLANHKLTHNHVASLVSVCYVACLLLQNL